MCNLWVGIAVEEVADGECDEVCEQVSPCRYNVNYNYRAPSSWGLVLSEIDTVNQTVTNETLPIQANCDTRYGVRRKSANCGQQYSYIITLSDPTGLISLSASTTAECTYCDF